MEWEVFLAPYKQAVDELKIKLRGYREMFEVSGENSPIEFVTGRVKPVPSIMEKARRKGIPIDQLNTQMQDLAGVRVMCQFVDDIAKVVRLIRNRTDMTVVEERDYINEKKKSGYRSYHVVVQYPVQTAAGEKKILVEIQVRTLAMNFWATIEHSLNYKYKGNIPADVKFRLLRAAEAAFRLDEEMSQIREEIWAAQQRFSNKDGMK
ncbi:MAG: GTP pyrophosphokinase family protein [Sporolactobacillus sp.]|jgi:putative GTP pyrophosphokinase|nr:GTP pyrophosphokinase family protein [Sporolactobacillus sp.]